MQETNSHRTDAGKVRVTITLDSEIYDKIKRISKDFGLPPSTWITMLCTVRINDLEKEALCGANKSSKRV